MPSKVVMIPNGVDNKFCVDQSASVEAKRSLSEIYRLAPDCRIISYVGSIEYRKGTDVLAKAWPLIISKVPQARLCLAGPCYKNTEFYQQLEKMLSGHIGKTIFFEGIVSNPELYYRSCDVFVFPSRNESFGNVLIEAMACGTACVATKIEGVTEDILTDGYNGIIVEQEDHKALAEAVLSLLGNSELRYRIADNAVSMIEEKFRIERVAERYVELYKQLLNL
jgi:glycosyltransferase involved in cell wall biosynthesis